MKFTPFILTASLFTLVPAFAQEPAKPEPAKPAEAPGSAIAAAVAADPEKDWKDLEMLSKEDLRSMAKKHLTEFDKKAAAFKAANPNDARRWKLALTELQKNGMRPMAGMPAKKTEDQKKLITEILAAADADMETKGGASAMFVRMAKDTEFEALAKEHIAAYPDQAENKGFAKQIKRIETKRAVAADQKINPLSLQFTATNGEEVDVSKMRGKVVLVDFWATWCGPCVQGMPEVIETYKKFHDKGFEIVGISFDNEKDKDKLEKFTKEKGMPWPQYYDGKTWDSQIGERFGIGELPTMWLVDKKGMVIDTNGRQDMVKKIEKLLAE